MIRAIALAEAGAGWVWSNPPVGAVLVHNNIIIGEGFHARYGEAHAEINCLNSVATDHRHLIAQSTMYVTLEPCSHYGKTPPCAQRLIDEKISTVVIGATDPSEKVNGKGVAMLRDAGITVITGMMESECRLLARHFFHYHEKHRPFVTIKWATTADGFIGDLQQSNIRISGSMAQRFTHQLRSTHMGIMVGYRTALVDNPSLTLRYASGLSPTRIVIDPAASLPDTLTMFNDNGDTLVLCNEDALSRKPLAASAVRYLAVDGNGKNVEAILQTLTDAGIQSVLVEGGAALLQLFIHAGYFDEVFVITNTKRQLGNGVAAPALLAATLTSVWQLEDDRIEKYERSE